MNILILAAGFGTRLLEYGEVTPKGLIPSAHGTLMNHILDESFKLKSPLALVTNEKFYTTYSNWLSKEYPANSVQILNDGVSKPEERRGAIGDILFALEQLKWEDDDLLVTPSDTFFEFSLTEFATFAQDAGIFSTVVRDLGERSLIANRLGCPTVSDERIVAFEEKPSSPATTLAAIPFYFYPKHILGLLADYKLAGGNTDAPGSVIPWLLTKQIPVGAFQTSSRTLDVGTPEDVSAVHSL